MPPDFAELGCSAQVRDIVCEAVTMAAQESRREQSEHLADRVGRAVVRELAEMLNTGKVKGDA